MKATRRKESQPRRANTEQPRAVENRQLESKDYPGNNVRVKGGLGAVLVIAEENETDYSVKEFATAIVDGKDIKADTWYKLENGKLVEDDE